MRHRIIRRLIGMAVTDIVNTTSENLRISGVKSMLELQQLDHNLVGFSEDTHRRIRELKDFLYKNLYRHYRVMRMQVKAERILAELFQAYVSHPTMLPTHIQAWISERKLERAICDYIAGMTDRYAIDEHQKLFDPAVLP